MPLLVHRNPKLRKHRASGQAVVSINGKEEYLGKWNSKESRLEYQRIIALWHSRGRKPPIAESDLAITELCDLFMQYAAGYYRKPDGTQTSEFGCFRLPIRVLESLYGPTLAANFGPLALEAVRNAMIAKGWKRGSINDQVGRIRRIFRWMIAKELIPAAVHHGLSAVAGLRAGRSDAAESEPVQPVADEIVEATIQHLTSVVASIVKVQCLTGARPGEICNMKSGEIDTTGDVWMYKPASHKTAHHGKARIIAIGPKAQSILQSFLKPLNPAAFIFSPRDSEAERREKLNAARKTPAGYGNGIGTNRKRHPKRKPSDHYDVAALRHAIARACDRAGVERWHPHRLRHSAGTEIRRRFGIEAAQTILGHANISTAEIYAEKNAEAGRAIALAVG